MVSADKRVTFITGGSRGIGRAIALELARPGDVVAFNHYDPDDNAAEETLKMLREKGVTAEALKFDVTDPKAVNDYVQHLNSTYGSLDILVNNAGITKDGLLLRMSLEQFEQVIKVNLTGCFVCLQAAAKVMIRQRRGSIVNMASVVGFIGNPGQANYTAAKGGLVALTKTAARELASRNVRVNAVAPGFIETEMTAVLPEKAREVMLSQVALGRPGTPEDVARVVNFLCSPAAEYMTGQIMHVDGGMYM